MSELLNNLLTSEQFIPDCYCYLWKTGLIWLHLVSDSLIALVCYSIALALFYLVQKRKDLPFNWIFLLFGAFIIACGTTHLMEVWTLWHLTYWLSGLIKAIAALASACIAVLLIPSIPKVLALPSPTQLEAVNVALRNEIAERKQAEEALRQQFQKEQLLGAMQGHIRQSLNLEEILESTVADVRQALESDRVLVYRVWSRGTGSVVTEAVALGCSAILGRAFPEEVFPQELHQPYCQGRICAVANVEQSNIPPCLVEFVQQFGVKAFLVVPILQGRQLWGLLIVHQCSSQREWQQFEIDLLRSLTDQVAIAIQQAELYEQSSTATLQARTQAQQLEQAITKLQRTQAQLVQNEKIASLGQLVAGIAHEINNPVSFIYGNITPATGYARDLLHLVELYRQHYPEPGAEITEQLERIDLDFITEDFPKLLASMKEGANRISQIVRSLRNFSCLDQKQCKHVDIHEGIDSTLLVLQHRLQRQPHRPEIQIIKEYGELPQVECYPQELNQVFMNVLSNAIDALEDACGSGYPTLWQYLRGTSTPPEYRGHGNRQDAAVAATAALTLSLMPSTMNNERSPKIWIHTEVIKGDSVESDAPGGLRSPFWVTIRIADNGPGMSEEVLHKIFDPFFTTKSVGSGTGLGLSISYQIVVDKHGGQLRCHSVAGIGTEFVIELPIVQGKMPHPTTRTKWNSTN